VVGFLPIRYRPIQNSRRANCRPALRHRLSYESIDCFSIFALLLFIVFVVDNASAASASQLERAVAGCTHEQPHAAILFQNFFFVSFLSCFFLVFVVDTKISTRSA
jgi:hypothetical protein